MNDMSPIQTDNGERLASLVGKLEAEALRRVGLKAPVEARWLEDLMQYHGRYNAEVEAKIKETAGSMIFLNMTAPKTDTLVARLWDLLFPTDDRNWGIGPTPVPELVDGLALSQKQQDDAKADADMLMQQRDEAAQAGDTAAVEQLEAQMRAFEDQQNSATAESDRLNAVMNAAKEAAELMQNEIQDQLLACNFPVEARDAITDAGKIGFGVIKGPVLGGKGKQKWVASDAQPDQYALEQGSDTMPSAHRVDPWSFFPDPAVRRIEDSDGNFERHLMTPEKLRRLVRSRPDMNRESARAILGSAPMSAAPGYMSSLRTVTGSTDTATQPTYHVWEYTGTIEPEDMETLQQAFAPAGETPPEVDLLESHHVRIWFCQSKVLSFALHPLDSGETIYSTLTVRPDETSVFGYGIPWIMRHPQAVLNGAARMMMDNSGLSTGPQIVINKDAVTPEDGSWNMSPRKVWLANTTALTSNIKPFEAFNITSNQVELENIIRLAGTMIDETTGMPAIAQGEQGAGVTKTAQGMAMLLNSANVSFRRLVKGYDDNMGGPLVRRFYHWNMQFSDKAAIKGDYDVQVRGSSVLLVREMQATNMLMIAQIFGGHPVYGSWIKDADLLRSVMRAHSIPVDEIIRTDREHEEWLAKQAQQPDPLAVAQEAANALKEQELAMRDKELSAKLAISEKEWDTRELMATMQFDGDMDQAVAKLNAMRDKMGQDAIKTDREIQHKERGLAAEIAMAQQTGVSSGGAV